MSNIAEGFNAGTDMEFVRFLSFARRSNSEVQSQAYIAMDLSYISPERFKSLYGKANLIERQINALIAYLAKSRHRVKEASTDYDPSDLSGVSDLSDVPGL
jgi:four helix bundle protein